MFGKPVSGVSVDLFSANPDGSRVGYLRSAVTDGSGNYSLALPAGIAVVGVDPASLAELFPAALYPGPYALSAAADVTGSFGHGVLTLSALAVPTVIAALALRRPTLGAR